MPNKNTLALRGQVFVHKMLPKQSKHYLTSERHPCKWEFLILKNYLSKSKC